MKSPLPLTDTLYQFVLDNSLREPASLAALGNETSQHRLHYMQTTPEQVQFICLLAQLVQAKRIVEVGVFTGYTTLALALSCPTAEILGCDISEELTSVALPHWEAAGVQSRIRLKLQAATQSLAEELESGMAGQYDLAYIDADKPGYPTYYERCLELVRPGGLVLLDNMLLNGRVAQPIEGTPPGVSVIKALSPFLRDDPRIDFSLLPIGDGLAICRKR